MSASDDDRWMSLALSLGARGLGSVWPNPAVGCVIVAQDRVVGRGWTQPGGRPHAETMALAQAGAAARGATAYVSLEPCAHHGATPPCADALIAAAVARVVTPMADPNPKVCGRGLARLEAAGIDVVTGTLRDAAQLAHAGFFARIALGRPLLTLKLAASFDGRIATASGDSQWITGSQARRHVHALRARHDAVWVGAGTARADLPSLTVRGLGIARQPVRIVSSARLDLPDHGPLAEQTAAAPLWLIHGPEAPAERRAIWQSRGAELIEVPLRDGALDPGASLQALGHRGVTRVLCEGGGQLAAALLRADLVDEIHGFTAGILLGADGRASLGDLGIDALSAAPHFSLVETRRIGPDVLHQWRRPAQTP